MDDKTKTTAMAGDDGDELKRARALKAPVVEGPELAGQHPVPDRIRAMVDAAIERAAPLCDGEHAAPACRSVQCWRSAPPGCWYENPVMGPVLDVKGRRLHSRSVQTSAGPVFLDDVCDCDPEKRPAITRWGDSHSSPFGTSIEAAKEEKWSAARFVERMTGAPVPLHLEPMLEAAGAQPVRREPVADPVALTGHSIDFLATDELPGAARHKFPLLGAATVLTRERPAALRGPALLGPAYGLMPRLAANEEGDGPALCAVPFRSFIGWTGRLSRANQTRVLIWAVLAGRAPGPLEGVKVTTSQMPRRKR